MPVSAPIDPDLHRAIDRALAGDWPATHEIVQAREGDTMADWIHAVVHRHEGDLGNARYWYGRCGRALPGDLAITDELRASAPASSPPAERRFEASSAVFETPDCQSGFQVGASV